MKRPTSTRRSFLQGLAALPAMDSRFRRPSLRETFRLDFRVDVLMILSVHATPIAAERWRREYAATPFDSTGEWYLGSIVELDLPEELADMPGSLAQFDYIAGVAAAKSSMLVGAFRRDHIACVYRVRGDTDDVIALAEDFASLPIPGISELLWNPTRLQSFIPTTGRIGMDVSPSDAFWP